MRKKGDKIIPLFNEEDGKTNKEKEKLNHEKERAELFNF